jgi:serine/threonine protein kinase
VRLDIIRSMNSKEEILQAIEKWAPQASRQPELVSFLQPPSDFSYTDIWMEALSAPPKRDKLKPLVPGAVLKDSQYRVQRLLAVGGQGSVYLANDSVVAEDIVLKEFVLPVYVDLSIRRKTIERFEKEARLLKQLDHHKIVKLLDFFVEDHRAYLVLEHLDGKNLRDLVKHSGRRSEKETVSLALQMCEILRYLHNQDPVIIHRDFTPDNLILGNDGQLRLIDFNVAQSLDNAATTTGTVVGKPSYLAPEQFQGEPTALSDLYSMGASLHYILTATDPVPIAQSHPTKVVPTISEGLDNIVAMCTEYNMALRYQSVEELEQALRALSDSVSTS